MTMKLYIGEILYSTIWMPDPSDVVTTTEHGHDVTLRMYWEKFLPGQYTLTSARGYAPWGKFTNQK